MNSQPLPNTVTPGTKVLYKKIAIVKALWKAQDNPDKCMVMFNEKEMGWVDLSDLEPITLWMFREKRKQADALGDAIIYNLQRNEEI